MSNLESSLAQNPWFGFIATIFGALMPFISSVLPIFQLMAVIVGLGIGLLTFEAKWKERKIRKRKNIKKADYE